MISLRIRDFYKGSPGTTKVRDALLFLYTLLSALVSLNYYL